MVPSGATGSLPLRLIASQHELFLRYIFDSWSATPGSVDAGALAIYLDALAEPTVASICADYRASFWLDLEHDWADRQAERRIACPVLVVKGETESQLGNAETVWRRWASDIRAITVPGGHFIPEEAPRQLANLLREFL